MVYVFLFFLAYYFTYVTVFIEGKNSYVVSVYNVFLL